MAARAPVLAAHEDRARWTAHRVASRWVALRRRCRTSTATGIPDRPRGRRRTHGSAGTSALAERQGRKMGDRKIGDHPRGDCSETLHFGRKSGLQRPVARFLPDIFSLNFRWQNKAQAMFSVASTQQNCQFHTSLNFSRKIHCVSIRRVLSAPAPGVTA